MSQPTIATRGEMLYLDSCVIIAFFTKTHPFHAKAKDMLSKIENKKFTGVVSSLSLMEFIKILREALVESGQLGSMSDIESVIKQHLKVLYVIDNIRFVEGRPPEFEPIPEIESVYFYLISHNGLKIISQYCGHVELDNNENRKHDGLSPLDALHVALAKFLGCDKLVTTDWDFRECQNEITPLILEDRHSIW